MMMTPKTRRSLLRHLVELDIGQLEGLLSQIKVKQQIRLFAGPISFWDHQLTLVLVTFFQCLHIGEELSAITELGIKLRGRGYHFID